MADEFNTGLADSEGVPENTPNEDSLQGVLESSFNALSERDSESSDEGSPAESTTTSPEPSESTQSAADQGEPDSAPGEASEESHASVEAPAHWSAADREMFGKQPPEARKWLMERSRAMEAAHTRRSQELAQQQQQFSQQVAPVAQIAQKWQPYLQQVGAAFPQAVDLLFDKEYRLRTGSQDQKIEIVRQIIADYGIEPPGGGEESQAPVQDPRVDQLTQQIHQMQAGWQQQQAQTVQQQQAYQQQALGRAQASLQEFATTKGADGKLAHPHFGEVQNDMTRLAQADLAAGVQPDLQSLYDRAVWANGNTRSQLLSAQQGQEAERRRQEAEKAKRAGGQISGAGAPAAEQPKGLRETLEASWDRLSAA